MRIMTTALLATLAVGGLTLSQGPAGAAPLGIAHLSASAEQMSPVVQVRGRRNVGAAIAAGAALGVLGGIIASQQPQYYVPAPIYVAPGPAPDDAVAYCMRRYRSYDPYSGTYLGFDGLRHPCP